MSVALRFKEIDKTYMAECGGKGAMLGELTKLTDSLPIAASVPDGFVFTADVFARWLTENNIKDSAIEAALNAAGTDVKKLEQISNLLRDRLSKAPIPQEASDAITHILGTSSKHRFAVRSSGIGEDSENTSFAGQHDSFLNTNLQDIHSRVRDVWLSSFAPRVLYYRVAHKLTASPIRQAVVVQEMVDPDVAGVAFSCDPRSGSRNYGLVEYVSGLADKLVEGSVSPTSILFPKDMSTILNKHEAVIPVAKTVLELEKILGYPVDVEWAWKNGKVYLLQIRPITALPEALDDDKVKGLILKDPKWGNPWLVGDSFSGGRAECLGFVSREKANETLAKLSAGEKPSTLLMYRLLAVPFTTPDDLPIMEQVAGIVVTEGGITSHAAIVCRELKKPCMKIKSLDELELDTEKPKTQYIHFDGNIGAIYKVNSWSDITFKGMPDVPAK